MNEQVDNALGGHGFATVTSTQVGALYNQPAETLQYTRDKLVEIVAASICDAQLWVGAWSRANESERGMYRHMAAGAVDAILATGQLKVRE